MHFNLFIGTIWIFSSFRWQICVVEHFERTMILFYRDNKKSFSNHKIFIKQPNKQTNNFNASVYIYWRWQCLSEMLRSHLQPGGMEYDVYTHINKNVEFYSWHESILLITSTSVVVRRIFFGFAISAKQMRSPRQHKQCAIPFQC